MESGASFDTHLAGVNPIFDVKHQPIRDEFVIVSAEICCDADGAEVILSFWERDLVDWCNKLLYPLAGVFSGVCNTIKNVSDGLSYF